MAGDSSGGSSIPKKTSTPVLRTSVAVGARRREERERGEERIDAMTSSMESLDAERISSSFSQNTGGVRPWNEWSVQASDRSRPGFRAHLAPGFVAAVDRGEWELLERKRRLTHRQNLVRK